MFSLGQSAKDPLSSHCCEHHVHGAGPQGLVDADGAPNEGTTEETVLLTETLPK